MISPVSLLRTAARTSFRYWRRARVRTFDVCRPISKLANIASRVLWRISVLLLVFLAVVDFSSASTLGGSAVSASIISCHCMVRAAMRG